MKKLIYDLHLRLDERSNNMLRANLSKKNQQLKKKINQSEYVRQLICRDNQEQLGFDKENLISCTRTLAGLGNNVNQLAHSMNADMFTENDLKQLRKCMEDIAAMRMIIATLQKELF